jgi:hypothetical protein
MNDATSGEKELIFVDVLVVIFSAEYTGRRRSNEIGKVRGRRDRRRVFV